MVVGGMLGSLLDVRFANDTYEMIKKDRVPMIELN